jgi:menaquinone-dependent protoporphyrinogen oxidase
MKILVAAASKHGSTYEIAEAIGAELRQAGFTVDVRNAAQKTSVAGYDAAVLGSAVFMGSWLADARDLLVENQVALAQMPVWLFSSGPLGAENPQPAGDPLQVAELLAQTQGRGHQNFVGKLDKSSLKMGEKLIAKAVKAPFGDFRDWQAISAWAQEIAAALESVPA